MYLSLKGSLGHTAITDRVGESLLQIAEGSSAAYSLRNLGSDSPSVVRVRRESDNAERDFTAQDINTSVVENWVNQQIIPPLDLRELTPTGRDGPLIPAAAAYSLRNLSNSYTGNVVEVRRTSDDQVRSFTAVEVSNGTLVDWVNADVITYTSDFSAGVDGWFSIQGAMSSVDDPVDAGKVLMFTINDVATQHGAGRSSLDIGTQYTLQAQVYVPSSNVYIDGLTLSDGSRSIDSQYKQITKDQWVPVEASGVAGNANVAVYALDGPSINFQDPAGTDVFYIRNVVITQTTADGHVSTWYDQSGNTKHATQATPASQPKIVDAGVLVAGGIDFDGTDDYFDLDLGADLAQPNSFFMSHTSDTTSPVFNEYFDSAVGSPRTLLDAVTGYRLTAGVNLQDVSFLVETNRVLFSAFANSTSSFICKNGVSSAVGDAGTEGVNQFSDIGRSGIRYYDGKWDEFIIYNSDQSDNRTAFEANIGEVYGIAGIPAYDNTVNGFVETWYDQSGNGNNASQLTASQQPKIVDTGVLVTDRDGKVALNGKGAKLDLPDDTPMLSADGTYSLFAVVDFDDQRNGNDQFNDILRFDSKTNGGASSLRKPLIYLRQGTGNLESTGPSWTSGSVGYTLAETLSVQLLTTIANPALLTGNNTLYADGVLVSSSDLATSVNTETRLQIDSQIFDNQETTVTHFLSEVIYYPSDESAKRAAIENNIDNHYGITSVGSYVNAAGDSYINAAGDTYLQP